jgi:hypothetical protein
MVIVLGKRIAQPKGLGSDIVLPCQVFTTRWTWSNGGMMITRVKLNRV